MSAEKDIIIPRKLTAMEKEKVGDVKIEPSAAEQSAVADRLEKRKMREQADAAIRTYACQANRGMLFEDVVERACIIYRAANIAIINKQHTKMKPIRDDEGEIVSTKIYEKATVDFLGHYGGVPIAVECKYTSTDKIPLNRLQEHQKAFLEDWERIGGKSYVLVSFDLKYSFLIPWGDWRSSKGVFKRDALVENYRNIEIGGRFVFDWLDIANKLKAESQDDINGQNLRNDFHNIKKKGEIK